MTLKTLQNSLHSLLYHLSKDLEKQKFLYLSPSEVEFFEVNDLSGPFIEGASFHSAQEDMREARNCYALGRYTASVFHSMGVLERGLRALAQNVGEDASQANWQNIIDRIEKKIRLFRGLAKSNEKEAKLQFLSEAAKEFTYFKDGWRNHVSHAKVRYDAPRALSILNHTFAFMSHLSSQLREAEDDE